MPVYNGAPHVAQSVESVLGQTMSDIELIVVDDGSTDDTNQILGRYAARDSRIVLIEIEHAGISAALNHGWRAAKADYVARLDSDDLALPDRLARQADFLDAHPSVAAVGGATILIDDAGRTGSTVHYPTEPASIRTLLLRRNCFAHPAVTIRRSALEAVDGYRFDHVEDYDLWLRLSERFELANLPEPVILYRQHPGQISFQVLEEQAKRTLAVRAAARLRRQSGIDPLENEVELATAGLDQLGVQTSEVRAMVRHGWYAWIAILHALGHREDADHASAEAERILGRGARRGIAAAEELRHADLMLQDSRPTAAARHLARALVRAPGYTSSRLVERLRLRERRDT
jgi:glycosyltransferase involved in cell wall biosynthesis